MHWQDRHEYSAPSSQKTQEDARRGGAPGQRRHLWQSQGAGASCGCAAARAGADRPHESTRRPAPQRTGRLPSSHVAVGARTVRQVPFSVASSASAAAAAAEASSPTSPKHRVPVGWEPADEEAPSPRVHSSPRAVGAAAATPWWAAPAPAPHVHAPTVPLAPHLPTRPQSAPSRPRARTHPWRTSPPQSRRPSRRGLSSRHSLSCDVLTPQPHRLPRRPPRPRSAG